MAGRADPDLERILPLLPLKDAENLTPKRARDELVALADSRKDVPLPQPASVADVMIDGAAGHIAARVYKPAQLPAPTIIYFHGGGWVAGDLYTHDRQARTLCLDVGAVVLSVDYRRPPEVKFPGAFDDCFSATRWAANNITQLGGDGGRLAVAGDSAGGQLAASVAIACRDSAVHLKAQFLMYPQPTLSAATSSESENARFPSRNENAMGIS